VLVFVFGPLGFLYVGWELAVACLAMMVVLYFLVSLVGFGGFLAVWWVKWVVLGFVAYKAYTLIKNVREQTREDDEEVGFGFAFAVVLMSDAFVGAAMGLAAAAGIVASFNAIFVEERILRGVAVLFLGTPLLVWVAGMISGLAAMAIDALALAGRATELRKRWAESR
jgi:hypothetical protein